MSPEQARGEGHRVGSRSDIFSLGIVFFELLVGRKPFHGESNADLMEQIETFEPRSPRQYDDNIPKELDRICLKALSKRVSERYSTARDMADDLRHFLRVQPSPPSQRIDAPAATPVTLSPSTVKGPGSSVTPNTPTSDYQPLNIVPKGLRSFDALDADFFVELLPGPRDRNGLPDSIRFWKTRIEESDAERTFSVGLIYGPSGCGKSSLVKAGLLPRLSDAVIAVYVEATADDTEARLLKGLRRRCPSLSVNLGLRETLAALRRGQGVPTGGKMLIVLDQFEQWLHAKKEMENTELVQALRQCDGGRVQCIVMVRDDFWMAATRFMRDVEVRLVDGQNSAAVDLFPIHHAEKVLTAFGRAFGALPEAKFSQPSDPSIQAMVSRLENLSDQYRELRDGVRMAIQVANVDPEMALTRSRKVLEFVVRDVYERRVKEPAGTKPLENLLQRIVKDAFFPDRLDAYANTIRKLGNIGTHKFGEKVAAMDVHQSLTQLKPILDWYCEVERPEALVGGPAARHQPRGVAITAAPEQKQFIEQAIQGLAQEGKVISVRLALFAEMMKGKAWTPSSLKEVGGTEGVGVTFLEETFSAATAPPEHRYHQKAARSVLKALLPESGTDIKGHMQSYADLLEASGYASRPRDFDDLIRILDSEIRLITPTDPEGAEEMGARSASKAESESLLALRAHGTQRYYQLTHDYLVPSLRDWLTRKQKETRKGRAELLLADRAAVWNARPENRQLPSLWQSLSIGWLTAKKNWTPPQRTMMRQCKKYHAVRGLALVAVVALLGFAGYEGHGRLQAHALRRSLLDASTKEVPGIVADMAPYRRWINPLLRDAATQAESSKDVRKQLHASLSLLPVDATQVDYLFNRLFDATPQELPVIGDALAPHQQELLDKLWAVVFTPEKGKELQRLRAAAALAKYDPESETWAKASPLVANDLVTENPVFLGHWSEAFRSVKNRLLSPLSAIFRDQQPERTAERSLATNLLADYAADQPQVLASLLMNADEKQFAVIYPKFKDRGEQGLPILIAEIAKTLPKELPSSDDKRETLAKRQANAAVALLRMNQPTKVWPLLKHSPDPRVRSYLIHRLSLLGADAQAIVKQLDVELDITIRRALVLSLGEFSDKEFTPDDRQAFLPRLQEMYRTASDPGLHAASEWLLRTWKQEAWLKQLNDEWAQDEEQRAKRLQDIGKSVTKEKEKAPPQWYVNTQGQTYVVIPGPVEFLMGSPKAEKDHNDSEVQHQRRIGRTFALAAKSVTLEQYRTLTKDKYEVGENYTRHLDLPVVGVSWYMAAKYCNLLSKEEKIPEDQWCYETDAKGVVTKLKADYLSLTGYRLPTEAEMEYATRAGAVTSRYYGETDELLGNYAWYTKNSNELVQRVGTKKPNDLGFFDSLANCYTWCQEPYDDYPTGADDEAVEDKPISKEKLVVVSTDLRVLRGGSFNNQPSNVRSATRYFIVPTLRSYNVGFRPARTLTLDGLTALPLLPGGAENKK